MAGVGSEPPSRPVDPLSVLLPVRFFIVAHGIFVFITGLRRNTNHMFAGVESASWSGLPFFLLAMAVLIAAWLAATPFTIKHARLV
jgi:methionine sulfoxide reductase catalytic subunit